MPALVVLGPRQRDPERRTEERKTSEANGGSEDEWRLQGDEWQEGRALIPAMRKGEQERAPDFILMYPVVSALST